MASIGLSPSALYKTATFLNAICIPGHILLGLNIVHPTLNTIVTSSKDDKKVPARNLAGKRSAQACFNYINGSLLIAALLNWQWARTGGPRSLEEKLVFWTLIINGAIDGATYASAKLYAPLICMWAAPLCSMAALLL